MALKYPDLVSLLIAFLDSPDGAIVARATRAVALIALFNHGVISSSIDSIPRLCQLITKKGSEEGASAVTALASLSTNPTNRVSILAQRGFIPTLLPMLSFDQKSSFFRGANAILAHITLDSEAACK